MIKHIKLKSEFSHNVLTLITGSSIAQAIPILTSPVLTRIYTPEDFGVMALFVAIVGFFSVIASGRYEQAIILPRYDKYAINLFILSFILIVITSFCVSIVIFSFKNEILLLLKNDLLGDWLYLVPVTIFCVALLNLLMIYSNRLKKYEDIAKATVVKSIALVFAQLLIGILKNGFAGLIIGQVLSQVFANLKLIKNVIKDKKILAKISLKKMTVLMKRYVNFPRYNMPHAFLNTISASTPIFVFGPFFGSDEVGYYSLALMVVLSPMMIIASATAKVYNQKVVEIHNANGDINKFTISIIYVMGKRVLLPFVIFVAMAPPLFYLIFGEKWQISGVYLQLLSPYIFMIFIVSIISYLPNLYQKQSKAFLIEALYFVIKLISLSVGCLIYDNVYVALGLFSFSSVVVLLFNLKWFIKLTEKK